MGPRAATALAAAALACASDAGPVRDALATPDGMQRVVLPGVTAAFAMPGAELDGYTRLRFEEGRLTYRDARSDDRFELPSPGDTTVLSPSDEARIWRHFRDVFTREFRARSDFALVSDPGPGTLTVRAHVLDLVAREERAATGAVSRFGRRSPTFTLVLDVRDSLTDAPIARIVDRRGTVARNGLPRQIGGVVDSGGVRQQMLRWARALRRHLDRQRAWEPAQRPS